MKEHKYKAYINNPIHGTGIFKVKSINFNPLIVTVIIPNRKYINGIELTDEVQFFEGEVKLLEYVGLKDKNGEEIYEGYIAHAIWYSYEQPECETFGEVIFNNGWLSFCIWNESDKTMSEMNGQGYYTWEIEVLGNIYQNPELLEK